VSYAVRLRCSEAEWEELLADWSADYPMQGVVEEEDGVYLVFFASAATAERFAAAQGGTVEEIAPATHSWWEDWQPLEIGRRFFLCPPTVEAVTPPGRIRLDMIGANVFGGGEHQTTQLCLELLEEVLEPGQRMVDVGTGTGILSAAARGLGAGAVFACDVEPAAVAMARRHAEVWQGSAGAVRAGTVDLVVCNIHLAVMREILPDLLAIGAPLLLSGFLTTQIPELTAGLTVRAWREKDGWCAVWATSPE
jgi:ribosomal protein L11 methyltransferase